MHDRIILADYWDVLMLLIDFDWDGSVCRGSGECPHGLEGYYG